MLQAEMEKYMELALEEAEKARLQNEVPVGAVLVKDGRVIASAHNTCEQNRSLICHTEFLAMQEAAERLGGRLDGCTLFVTLEPCAMCAGAAINLRLSSLVFGAYNEKSGCCGSVADITDHWFLHSIETVGGILENRCSSLLTSFFECQRCKEAPYSLY